MLFVCTGNTQVDYPAHTRPTDRASVTFGLQLIIFKLRLLLSTKPGSSQWTHSQRQRNKAKPHNAPWFLVSMLLFALFVPAFPIKGIKSCVLESVQLHRAAEVSITRLLWAHWHICFHLTLPLTPSYEGHLHLSARKRRNVPTPCNGRRGFDYTGGEQALY